MATTPYKKIVQVGGLGIFFFIIILYALFVSHDLLAGVKIKNVDIVDGANITGNTLNVTGVAKNAVDLSLNGREISVDQQGNFNETIALLPGYNIIDIRAKDKFGDTDEKIYKLTH